MTRTENNLSVFYNSSEISLILRKVVQEHIHAGKKECQEQLQQNVEVAGNRTGESRANVGEPIGAVDVEKSDKFECIHQ